MTDKQNPSHIKTSSRIQQRTQAIIAKEKLKPEKELQDRQHKLNLERDKKALRLSKIAIFIALLSLLFSMFTYFDTKLNTINAKKDICIPNTTPAKTNQ